MEKPEPDFTDSERAQLRELLEAESRWAWVRSTLRTWGLAIATVVTGATLGLEALKTILRRLSQ